MKNLKIYLGIDVRKNNKNGKISIHSLANKIEHDFTDSKELLEELYTLITKKKYVASRKGLAKSENIEVYMSKDNKLYFSVDTRTTLEEDVVVSKRMAINIILQMIYNFNFSDLKLNYDDISEETRKKVLSELNLSGNEDNLEEQIVNTVKEKLVKGSQVVKAFLEREEQLSTNESLTYENYELFFNNDLNLKIADVVVSFANYLSDNVSITLDSNNEKLIIPFENLRKICEETYGVFDEKHELYPYIPKPMKNYVYNKTFYNMYNMIAYKILEDHERKTGNVKLDNKEFLEKGKRQFMNYGLFGEAGTGKNATIRQIAALLKMPYVVHSCSPHMVSDDLLGRLTPRKTESKTQMFNFDSYDEIKAYIFNKYKLSSSNFPDSIVEMNQVLKLYELEKNDIYKKREEERKEQLVFRLSLIMKVYVAGGFAVIDESNLAPSSVITILNNALADGFITVDTRYVINRAENCFICFTGNIGYHGLNFINQSTKDRLDVIFYMEEHSRAEMLKIASSEAGIEVDKNVELLYDLVMSCKEICKEEYIKDGVVGIRCLINMTKLYALDKFSFREIFTDALLNKASFDEDERELLICVFENNPLSERI